ncbi:MAG: DinB family protein [Anaerolineae bacterium]
MTTPQRQAYIDTLRAFPAQLEAIVVGLTDEQLESREAEGEWSVRQIVHHLADAHSNAVLRLKRWLTEDYPTSRDLEQVKLADMVDYTLPIESALLTINAVHLRFVTLFDSLTDEQWSYPQKPSEGSDNVENIARIYAWHGENHLNQIKRALTAGLRK